MRKGQVIIPRVADVWHVYCTPHLGTLIALQTSQLSIALVPAEPRYGFGILPHMALQEATTNQTSIQEDYLTNNAEDIS